MANKDLYDILIVKRNAFIKGNFENIWCSHFWGRSKEADDSKTENLGLKRLLLTSEM